MPEYKLPPYQVEDVISTLSQTKGWGIRQLNVPNTWSVTQGEGKTVYVIDSGFSHHVDLEGNMDFEKSENFTNWVPDNLEKTDDNGHSTHCCGIIAAKDNTTGMVGVAPKAKIVTGKVFGKAGTTSSEIINNALRYALILKPDVVSMSLGGATYDPDQHDLIKQLYALNIPVICAAGNEGAAGVSYPGKFDETITVAAYDEKGNIGDFSSIGEKVDFAAPGVKIYSTWLHNRYAYLNGTSMACPFITGVVLLLLAKHEKQEKETGKNDCKTVDQIKEHLIKYADDKGVLGKDAQWGYGSIDVEELITGKHAPKPLTRWEKFMAYLRKLFSR